MKLYARMCICVCVCEKERRKKYFTYISHIKKFFFFIWKPNIIYVIKYDLSATINPYIPKRISIYHSRVALRNR